MCSSFRSFVSQSLAIERPATCTAVIAYTKDKVDKVLGLLDLFVFR